MVLNAPETITSWNRRALEPGDSNREPLLDAKVVRFPSSLVTEAD
jgi:hypothetical protein